MEKRESELRIQYILEDEEWKAFQEHGKLEENQGVPYHSVWNGRHKISYAKSLPMEKLSFDKMREQEDTEQDVEGLYFRGLNNENCFVVQGNHTVLGKSREKADVVIHGSASVSRRHCRIIRKANQYFVEDLGSLNHTYKNGVLIEAGKPVELHKGDELRLSDIVLKIE